VAALVGVTSLALTSCTSSMREYGEIMKGRQPCNCDEAKPWCDYGRIMRGCSPCPDAGRPTCGSPCAPVQKPCGCAPAAKPCGCAPTVGPVSTGPSAMPADAKPGEAWCKVYVPATYETVWETVTTVCATTNQVWVPPVYETKVRQVCVQPERTWDAEIPGASKTIDRCETCAPARTETRTVTTKDACGRCTTRCETVEVPATNCTKPQDVCVLAPSRETFREPAIYVPEVCEVEVTPGRWETVKIPAVQEQVEKRVCVAPERWEWRRNAACAVPVPPSAPCAPAMPAAPAK
jgi:hypothetical protein